MKKYLLVFIVSTCYMVANAQVSIGATTPHQSAILDLNVNSLSQKKGFLQPRLNLTGNNDIVTISNPVNGLMIYNFTTANSGLNLINGKSTHYWDGTRWQHFTNRKEVISLKQPIEFVSSSKILQLISNSELPLVNANEIIPVTWGIDDIFIENEADIEFNESSNDVTIKTASYYDFSGMVNFRAVTATQSQSTHVILVLQKSDDNGANWEDILASSVSMEQNASSKVYTITLPNFIHYLNQNDKVRMVFKKPNYITANNYTGNSGIAVTNVGVDVTKSLRIVRIVQ
jgi:hypothetical protein